MTVAGSLQAVTKKTYQKVNRGIESALKGTVNSPAKDQ